jgi:hypothetical protein
MNIDCLNEIRLGLLMRAESLYGSVIKNGICTICNYAPETMGVNRLPIKWNSGGYNEKGYPIIFHGIIVLPCLACSNVPINMQLNKFHYQYEELLRQFIASFERHRTTTPKMNKKQADKEISY